MNKNIETIDKAVGNALSDNHVNMINGGISRVDITYILDENDETANEVIVKRIDDVTVYTREIREKLDNIVANGGVVSRKDFIAIVKSVIYKEERAFYA